MPWGRQKIIKIARKTGPRMKNNSEPGSRRFLGLSGVSVKRANGI